MSKLKSTIAKAIYDNTKYKAIKVYKPEYKIDTKNYLHLVIDVKIKYKPKRKFDNLK